MALIDLVKGKVKDDSGRLADETDYLPAVEAALRQYSDDRPLVRPVDLIATGAVDLDLPEDWESEFSRIRAVEYPVGLVPAVFLPPLNWGLYLAPAGEFLRLMTTPLPSVGDPVRVSYTLPRTEATVLRGDMDAVANLAAAICSETLASLFAQTSDPTISADAVNYRTKSAEFAARAKRFRQLYLDHFGVGGDGGPVAALVTAPPPLPTRGRLTHRRFD